MSYITFCPKGRKYYFIHIEVGNIRSHEAAIIGVIIRHTKCMMKGRGEEGRVMKKNLKP